MVFFYILLIALISFFLIFVYLPIVELKVLKGIHYEKEAPTASFLNFMVNSTEITQSSSFRKTPPVETLRHSSDQTTPATAATPDSSSSSSSANEEMKEHTSEPSVEVTTHPTILRDYTDEPIPTKASMTVKTHHHPTTASPQTTFPVNTINLTPSPTLTHKPHIIFPPIALPIATLSPSVYFPIVPNAPSKKPTNKLHS